MGVLRLSLELCVCRWAEPGPGLILYKCSKAQERSGRGQRQQCWEHPADALNTIRSVELNDTRCVKTGTSLVLATVVRLVEMIGRTAVTYCITFILEKEYTLTADVDLTQGSIDTCILLVISRRPSMLLANYHCQSVSTALLYLKYHVLYYVIWHGR